MNTAFGKRVAILMLENSSSDAELILNRLNQEGIAHQAQRVATEHEFRQLLDREIFDVILAEYSLPGFTGVQALKLARDAQPETPFIFVSGALGEEIAVEMLKQGATDYVLKHRLERLGSAIYQALSLTDEIKKRRLAEAALHQSESRYRLLAEATPNFVWTADENGSIVFVNQRFHEYSGLSWEDILARKWHNCIHPDDLPHLRTAWDEALQSDEGFELEFRCLRFSDGSYRWHLARVIPLLDETGKARQWLGTASDIETQKQAEQALRRSNEELQQFAFAASHDLQEPLRNVSTFTQLLARRYKDQLDEEAHEYIRYAVEGAMRMNELIHDLLAYSRIAMQEVTPQQVSMEAIFSTALDNLRLAIEESKAIVTHDELPEITANATQMFQVLQNLLSNAIKYRSPDRPVQVHVGASEAPGEWIFSVKDNGQGFDPSYADRIFGVFHRLHNRDVPGTGIGLSICKRVVERHGGHMWVKSRPDRGSTFYFSIPVLRLQ